MSRKPPSPAALRVADLSQNAGHGFDLRPDAAACAAIAQSLGFSALRKLAFSGRLEPEGSRDWRLAGTLGATVVQPCVVTLEPVTTRIDQPVTRLFAADYQDPEDPEAEMPEDDTVEPLGAWIDPEAVMLEALALAAPDYPRREDAELGQMVYTRPGDRAMTDADARPFAGLAALRDSLAPKAEED